MNSELEKQIKSACKQLYGLDIDAELTRPEEKFGDLTTNIALRLANKLQKPPAETAQTIGDYLKQNASAQIADINVADPGFINIKLTDEALLSGISNGTQKKYQNRQIVVEFGDANPFKEMHIGHLYTSVVGDSIARLFEVSGADVKRVSYHGDVGMHIAKAIWAITRHLNEQNQKDIAGFFIGDINMGAFYAEGAAAYEEDDKAKQEIIDINAAIYDKSNPEINEIYELGKALSFKNFDKIFSDLDISFVKKYLESESSEAGIKTVKENLGKVFVESEGAVIYKTEKAGLHTRVFINSRGLPTYETKDLGLAELKHKDFPAAVKSVIITDHQQADYFKVMLAALKEIDAELADKTLHLVHGHLGLTSGKMSSRSGKVYSAATLINDILSTVNSLFPDSGVKHEVFIASLKYAFLKSKLGGDIVFDVKESVAIEGNSGPYLQYSHARAKSILSKADEQATKLDLNSAEPGLDRYERSLVLKLSEYAETVDKSVSELSPHYICNYLFELARSFNRFYEQSKVIGDARQNIRLNLVLSYAETLKSGLGLLGISAPDKM